MAELRQKLMLCITTMERLDGRAPEVSELLDALGWEYAEVLAEYVAAMKAAAM